MLHLVLVSYFVINLTNGESIVENIKECKVPKNDIQNGFSIKINYNKATQSADLEMVTPFDINDDIEFDLTTEENINGTWQMDDFALQGSLCRIGEMYLPTLIEKLAKAMKLKAVCPLKAGTYNVQSFSIDAKDVMLPELNPGMQYRLKVVYSKTNNPIVCFIYEIKTE